MATLFVHFHAEKGEIFIGHSGFRIKAKKCHILGFWVLAVPPPLLGDTSTCRLTLGGTTAQSKRYDCLTELGD